MNEVPWRSEVAVDAALVARLVDAQFPRLQLKRSISLECVERLLLGRH